MRGRGEGLRLRSSPGRRGEPGRGEVEAAAGGVGPVSLEDPEGAGGQADDGGGDAGPQVDTVEPRLGVGQHCGTEAAQGPAVAPHEGEDRQVGDVIGAVAGTGRVDVEQPAEPAVGHEELGLVEVAVHRHHVVAALEATGDLTQGPSRETGQDQDAVVGPPEAVGDGEVPREAAVGCRGAPRRWPAARP